MVFLQSQTNHRKSTNKADTIWATYIISVTSASTAEILTYPLDLIKTRLQIQGEAVKSNIKINGDISLNPRGMIKTALGIIKEEGIHKMWQGVTPAIYRHVVYSGIRIVTYESIRDNILRKEGDIYFPVWKSALAGVTSGAIAQFIASPTDLVKVQIQMEGKRRLMGKPPRVHGVLDAVRKILKAGGIKGLWKGSVPNVQRAALVNLGDLTTYDTAKHLILIKTGLPDGPSTHVLSSICAGLVAAIMGTPADVIKTRIMNQLTNSKGKGLYYRSSIDCLVKTVKTEGFMALYKGFLPIWIRMAPWSLTFWLSFEYIRNSVGASSF